MTARHARPMLGGTHGSAPCVPFLLPPCPTTSPFPAWTAQSSDRDAIRRFRPNVSWGSWYGQSVPTNGGLVLVLLLTGLGTFATAYWTRYPGRSVPKATATVIEGGQRYIPVRDTTHPNARLVVKGERIACVGDTCTVPNGPPHRRVRPHAPVGPHRPARPLRCPGGRAPFSVVSPSVHSPPAPPTPPAIFFSSTATWNSSSRRSATSGSS